MRRLLVPSVIAIVCHASSSAAPLGAASQDDALVGKLAPPMNAVAALVAAERWNPRLDEIVQRAPAAAALGPKWSRSAAGWQKARAALGARVTRVVDLYGKSDELPRELQAALGRIFPGAQGTALARMLDGPAGPAIIRAEASSRFVVSMMSDSPDGPQPGSAEWQEQLSALSRTFSDRIGPAVPRDDPAHEQDAMKFMDGPMGGPFSQLWLGVVGKAGVTIDGAINLMLFDNGEAINREIAQAVATVK